MITRESEKQGSEPQTPTHNSSYFSNFPMTRRAALCRIWIGDHDAGFHQGLRLPTSCHRPNALCATVHFRHQTIDLAKQGRSIDVLWLHFSSASIEDRPFLLSSFSR